MMMGHSSHHLPLNRPSVKVNMAHLHYADFPECFPEEKKKRKICGKVIKLKEEDTNKRLAFKVFKEDDLHLESYCVLPDSNKDPSFDDDSQTDNEQIRSSKRKLNKELVEAVEKFVLNKEDVQNIAKFRGVIH